MIISKKYTPETPYRVRAFDDTLTRFFDSKESAQAFIRHPANNGKEFCLTKWVLPENAI